MNVSLKKQLIIGDEHAACPFKDVFTCRANTKYGNDLTLPFLAADTSCI